MTSQSKLNNASKKRIDLMLRNERVYFIDKHFLKEEDLFWSTENLSLF